MTAPIVPPLLAAIMAPEPFDAAIQAVRAGRAGAGDFFWSPDAEQASLAIVLEPEVDAGVAAQMAPLAMVALGDTLGVLTPPQVGVQFREPFEILVNAGVAGRARAAMARTGKAENVPDWLVIGVETGLARPAGAPEPGLEPDITTLDEEGCGGLSHITFIETFARHFLSWMAVWNDDGFAPVARSWKFRAEDECEPDMEKIRAAFVIYESRS